MNKGTHFIGQPMQAGSQMAQPAATMFRIMLMYNVNCYTFFEEPEKDWAKILEDLELKPPEHTLFD